MQGLSRIRLAEAKALLSLGFHDGPYYLAGYAIECALKACIAKQTKKSEFPDKKRAEASHTHSLRDLVRVANLEEARVERAKTDPDFETNWEVVRSWSEQSRVRKASARESKESRRSS